MTIAGSSIFDKINEKYIAARVKVPAPASLLTELCRLAVPWKAVKCTINANPRTQMLRLIRHFSCVPKITDDSAISGSSAIFDTNFVSVYSCSLGSDLRIFRLTRKT